MSESQASASDAYGVPGTNVTKELLERIDSGRGNGYSMHFTRGDQRLHDQGALGRCGRHHRHHLLVRALAEHRGPDFCHPPFFLLDTWSAQVAASCVATVLAMRLLHVATTPMSRLTFGITRVYSPKSLR